ncbi:hypothetical protein BDV11DRAFT_199870 [Aspergillus similis]
MQNAYGAGDQKDIIMFAFWFGVSILSQRRLRLRFRWRSMTRSMSDMFEVTQTCFC